MVETLSNDRDCFLFCGRKWAMARAIEKITNSYSGKGNHVCRTTTNGCQTNRSDLVSTMAPAGKTVSEVLLETLNATELNETTASLAVHQTMKENGQLFVSNSMAIRYLDRFMDSRPYRMFEIAASTGLMGLFQLL